MTEGLENIHTPQQDVALDQATEREVSTEVPPWKLHVDVHPEVSGLSEGPAEEIPEKMSGVFII